MDVKLCTGAASVLKEVTRNPIGGNARCSAIACNRRRMRATGPIQGITDCHRLTAATVCAAGSPVYLGLSPMQTNIKRKVSFQDH